MYQLVKRVYEQHYLVAIYFAIMVSLIVTASWYLSYPRFDTRYQHKGYNASRYDYDAVRWIHQDGNTDPYVVLANQTVSGVAVKEFGFAHYYNDLFYYPLPTSGVLYPHYLSVVATESEIMRSVDYVRLVTGVSRIYVVINDYWSDSLTVRERHRALAQESTVVGDGAIEIFIYH